MPVDEIMMIIFGTIYGMIRHLYCQILTNNAIPKILHNVYIEDRLSRFIFLRILSFFSRFTYLAAKSQCAMFMDSKYFMPDAIWVIKLKWLS